MKTLVAICVLSLSIIGCASDRVHRDSFASLHGLVMRTLAHSSDCGPIIANEVSSGRYFEVKPRPRGLAVTVFERQFFSQTEWETRYASGTNLLAQFMEMATTNPPMDAETVARFAGLTNFFGLFELPAWHYQDIGVDVRVQEVDEVYPGLDQDDAEARKRYAEIVQLLKPYHQLKQ